MVERLGFDENFVDVTGLVEKRLMQGGIEEAEVIGHQYGEQSSGMRINVNLLNKYWIHMSALFTECNHEVISGLFHFMR